MQQILCFIVSFIALGCKCNKVQVLSAPDTSLSTAIMHTLPHHLHRY